MCDFVLEIMYHGLTTKRPALTPKPLPQGALLTGRFFPDSSAKSSWASTFQRGICRSPPFTAFLGYGPSICSTLENIGKFRTICCYPCLRIGRKMGKVTLEVKSTTENGLFHKTVYLMVDLDPHGLSQQLPISACHPCVALDTSSLGSKELEVLLESS